MLATYTPFESRVLEDHYIACAKREGIWGMGRPPGPMNDKTRAAEAGTAAGLARQQRKERAKQSVLDALRKGCNTTSGLSVKLGLSDSCVRRYLRELGHDGYVRIAGFCPRTGGRRWAAIN